MLSDTAAEQLVRRRDELGLTREDLAQRCKRLGWPGLTYGVITTIENGRRDKDGKRRREVSLDEWVVLARALEVSPLLFLAPLGREDTVEILPGQHVRTFDAYQWLTGMTTWVGQESRPGIGRPADEIAVYRDHHDAAFEYAKAQADGDTDREKRALRKIRDSQQRMSSRGWRVALMWNEEP